MLPLLHSQAILALWDFHEPHPPFLSKGKLRLPLFAHHAPIRKIPSTSPLLHPIHIPFPAWLHTPRHLLGPLNLHGYQPLSLFLLAAPDSPRPWQFLAGIWNEHDHTRQFALFYNGTWQFNFATNSRSPCQFRIHAYLSREGGHTPGNPACFSYATGATPAPPHQWHSFAMTWDGTHLSAFLNGKLDPNPNHNPLPFSGPIFLPSHHAADFTVAQRPMALWHSFPHSPMPANEGFSGYLALLAVFQRPLSPDEILHFHNSLTPHLPPLPPSLQAP